MLVYNAIFFVSLVFIFIAFLSSFLRVIFCCFLLRLSYPDSTAVYNCRSLPLFYVLLFDPRSIFLFRNLFIATTSQDHWDDCQVVRLILIIFFSSLSFLLSLAGLLRV
jgi:hypothetical protein